MPRSQLYLVRVAAAAMLLGPVPHCLAQNKSGPGRAPNLPSVDEVLGKSLLATGGRDAWLKLTSLRMKASVSMNPMGLTGSADIYSKAPDKESDCITFESGIFFCRAYDGHTGWQDDSKDGLKPLEGKSLDDMRRDADFYSELNRRKNYSTMKVAREDDFDGLRVYVVEATRNDGQKQEIYFAKELGFEVGRKEFGTTPDDSKTVFLEDYQQLAGAPVKIPTKVRMISDTLTMLITVEEIFPNVEIPDSKFAKPEKSARDPEGAGETGRADNGKVTDGVYRNEYFGFLYTLPEGWTVHGEETEKALMETGKELIAGDNEQKKIIDMASKRSYHLLTIFEFPLGTPGKPNRSLQLIAENVSFAPGIQTGKDYIVNLQQVLAGGQLQMHLEGEPVEEILDGVSFYRQAMSTKIGAIPVYELIYSTKLKGYIVSYIMTAQTKEGVEEVAKSLASFHKTPRATAK